jgi:hypothetical protein
MTRILSGLRVATVVVLLPVMATTPAFGWGADGHRIINRLAGAALPPDVPSFLRSPEAVDALGYYGPEPDRWRSPTEPELNAAQAPEHFIDLEWADLVLPNGAGALPRKRYDFIRALAAAQPAHPDIQLTPEKVGLQPYVTIEVWERLKAAMREYRGLAARHEDSKPVECEIVFLAGWLGHYVADGSMPLHTSIQYNGWTGPNPNGYTTEHHIHALFESNYVAANVKAGDVDPLVSKRPRLITDVFDDYMAYLRHSNTLVEGVYQLEKTGAFTGPGTPDGKAMVDERLGAGATELRDMIYTAWIRSADPVPEYKPDKPVAK